MRYIIHVGAEVRELELSAGAADGTFLVKLGDRTIPVVVRITGDGALLMSIDGRPSEAFVVRDRASSEATVCIEGQALAVSCRTAMEEQLARASEAAGEATEMQVRCNMPGKIVEVKVGPGDLVIAGQKLVVLEAMKMENEIQAKGAARVKSVLVKPGQAVDTGALLVELEPADGGKS